MALRPGSRRSCGIRACSAIRRHQRAPLAIAFQCLTVPIGADPSPIYTVDAARSLGTLGEEFSRSIDIAFDALRRPNDVPDVVAAHRLTEVLVWMDFLGSRFEPRESTRTGSIVRRFICLEVFQLEREKAAGGRRA